MGICKEGIGKGNDRYYPSNVDSEHDFQQYNTGFCFYMPTHNTKAFLDTLVEVWPVTMQYRTDQLLFNTVIHSKQFTQECQFTCSTLNVSLAGHIGDQMVT